MDHGPDIDLGRAHGNAFESGVKFFQRYFGQEPQRPQIHTHNRNASLRSRSRRREKSAIPAQNNNEIQLSRGHFRARDAFYAFRVRSGFRINNNCVVVAPKPFHQRRHDLRDFWLVRLGDNANGLLRW